MNSNQESIEFKDTLKLLLANMKRQGREEVFTELRNAFSSSDAFKGRIYFDDAEDLINTIKIRMKGKYE